MQSIKNRTHTKEKSHFYSTPQRNARPFSARKYARLVSLDCTFNRPICARHLLWICHIRLFRSLSTPPMDILWRPDPGRIRPVLVHYGLSTGACIPVLIRSHGSLACLHPGSYSSARYNVLFASRPLFVRTVQCPVCIPALIRPHGTRLR